MGYRGQGRLFLPRYRNRKTGELRCASVWWIDVGVRGDRTREPTGIRGGRPGKDGRLKPPREAVDYLARRTAELGRVPSDRGLVWEDMAGMILDDAKARELRSLRNMKIRLVSLNAFFGGVKAREITSEKITAYCAKRREAGLAIATINFEIYLLSTGFNLAMRAGRIAQTPYFRRLKGAKVRTGIVSAEAFAAIREQLRDELRGVAVFLWLTGWRCSEPLTLERRQVDWATGLLHLGRSKNGLLRMLPFGEYPPLRTVLEAQEARARAIERDRGVIVRYLFHLTDGGPVTVDTLESAWARARKRTPFRHVLLHDLRRTMVTEMERRGVPRTTAMAITGHQSEAVYRRYAIGALGDISAALTRLSDRGLDPPEHQLVLQFPAAGGPRKRT